jgi:hypothetical protein
MMVPIILAGPTGATGRGIDGIDAEDGAMGPPGATGPAGAVGPMLGLLDQPIDSEAWPAGAPSPGVVSAVTTPAVPASTVAAVNTTGRTVNVYVKAGTLTDIAIGGVSTGIAAAAPASTCHTLEVSAGQTIAITYTVAPSWVWIGT